MHFRISRPGLWVPIASLVSKVLRLIGLIVGSFLAFIVLAFIAVLATAVVGFGTAGFVVCLFALLLVAYWIVVAASPTSRAERAERQAAIATERAERQAAITAERQVHERELNRIRAGQLPLVDQSPLLTRSGELVHLAIPAALKAEVKETSWKGGGGGASVGVGPFRFGGGSGSGRRYTSTSIGIVDSGTLCVTSQRAVFMGKKETIELSYSKILGFQAGGDTLLFHLPNRKLRRISPHWQSVPGDSRNEQFEFERAVVVIETAIGRARQPQAATS